MSLNLSVRRLRSDVNRLESQINGIREFFEPGPHRNAEIKKLNSRIAELRSQIFALLNTRSGG